MYNQYFESFENYINENKNFIFNIIPEIILNLESFSENKLILRFFSHSEFLTVIALLAHQVFLDQTFY